MTDDLAHELRVLARLMENKKTWIDFGEQDAAVLRKAAEQIETLRAVLRRIADPAVKFSDETKGLQEIARAAVKERGA